MKRKLINIFVSCLVALAVVRPASAEIYNPGDDQYIGGIPGIDYSWGVYGAVRLGAWNPSELSPLQWLYKLTPPATAPDKSGNENPSEYRNSNMATFDGVAYLSVSELTGSETVTSSGGTSTPSISSGQIAFTAGTCWNLVLDNGSIYPFSEGATLSIGDTVNGYGGTIVSGTASAIWASTQNEFHKNTKDGFYRTVTTAQASQPHFTILGDSLTAQNVDGYEMTPAGSVGYANSRGYFNWMRTYLTGTVWLDGNDGASGETSTDILARVPDIIAKAPDFCIVCAGRNDVSQEYALATTTANLSQINSDLTDEGITVIFMTVTPSIGDSASQILLRSNINSYISSTFDNVSDSASVIDDGSGAPITGSVIDSTHWSERGAQAVGELLSTLVQSLCTPSPFEWHDTTHDCNAMGNPTFDDSGSGWAGSGATFNVVDGGLDCVSTIDGQSSIAYLENISGGLYSVGDNLRCAIDIEWDITSQTDDRYWHPNIVIRRRLSTDAFEQPYIYGLLMSSSEKIAGMPTESTGSCTLMTPVFPINADTDRLYISIGFDTAVVGGEYRINKFSLWNVDTAETEVYPYVPALEDGSDIATNGEPLTNPSVTGNNLLLNNSEACLVPSTEALTDNPFWAYQADVLGDELITNGDFSDGSTGWSLAAGASVVSGELVFLQAGSENIVVEQDFGAVLGSFYNITYEVTANTGFSLGDLLLSSTGAFGVTNLAVSVGVHEIDLEDINASPTADLRFVTAGSVGNTISIDNVSIKEILFEPGEYRENDLADFLAHNPFDSNVCPKYRFMNGQCFLKEVPTWLLAYQWTPENYIEMVDWLGTGCGAGVQVPQTVESGGIGPDGLWRSLDGIYIRLLDPE